MPRRRRSHRVSVYRPLKAAKYSNETYAFGCGGTYSQNRHFYVVVSPQATTLGTRKAKNFTVRITGGGDIPTLWALVFVPEGTPPNTLNFGSQPITEGTTTFNGLSLYEPNQNVIISGVCRGGAAGVITAKTRLARNLNSNDYIVLIIRPMISYDGNMVYIGSVNYAISY